MIKKKEPHIRLLVAKGILLKYNPVPHLVHWEETQQNVIWSSTPDCLQCIWPQCIWLPETAPDTPDKRVARDREQAWWLALLCSPPTQTCAPRNTQCLPMDDVHLCAVRNHTTKQSLSELALWATCSAYFILSQGSKSCQWWLKGKSSIPRHSRSLL